MASIQFMFDPGHAVTGRVATGQTVTAGMLVALAAPKVDAEVLSVKPCGASDQPLGVVDADGKAGELVTIHRVGVGTVRCSTATTAGSAVQPAAAGKVAPLASGLRVGVALTTTTAADDPMLVALAV